MKETRSSARWEHFAHPSDIGVRGYGATPEQAFEQAAAAMIAVVADLGTIRSACKCEIECDAPDIEQLFVNWLNELVCEMSTRGMLLSKFDVHIAGTHLTSEAWGEHVDPSRHRPAAEVKAATRAELKVSRLGSDRWMAQCIVDV